MTDESSVTKLPVPCTQPGAETTIKKSTKPPPHIGWANETDRQKLAPCLGQELIETWDANRAMLHAGDGQLKIVVMPNMDWETKNAHPFRAALAYRSYFETGHVHIEKLFSDNMLSKHQWCGLTLFTHLLYADLSCSNNYSNVMKTVSFAETEGMEGVCKKYKMTCNPNIVQTPEYDHVDTPVPGL